MKTKILKILKYGGIGFLGLLLFTIVLGSVLPDVDTDQDRDVVAQQTENLDNENTESTEISEEEVEETTDSSGKTAVQTTVPWKVPQIRHTPSEFS